MMLQRLVLISFAFSLAACSLANPDLLERLGPEDAGSDPMDGGPVDTNVPPEDAGPQNAASNRCNDENILVIDETTTDLYIDTRNFGANVNVTDRCGVASQGSDGFIAIDVQALDTWHFHLQVIGATDKNPSLYLLPSNGMGGCTDTFCEQISDSCTGAGEEHFSFVPTEDGRWFIAIDDGVSGGAEYSLSAYRTFCDGALEHGEACDGTPGCSNDCRVELTETNTRIETTQQNFVEAARVLVPASGVLTVTGSIGDMQGLCDYPDVFTLTIPAGGAELTVRPDECMNRADARYDLTLRTASGSTLETGRQLMGCPFISRMGGMRLEPGQYFIELDHDPLEPTSRTQYNLRFEVTP